jgi:phospholipase/carboxylesterase
MRYTMSAEQPGDERAGQVVEMVHLTREPAGAPDGALILLHGRAVDERDLYPMLDELDPERKLLGITPGAPLTNVPPGGRHWYVIERIGQPDEETFVTTLGILCRFLDDELRRRGISWEKTVIGGFSQGAAVACAVAIGMGRPRAAGLLMMSGFYPMVRGWELDPGAKRGMPAYVTHGVNDPVNPDRLRPQGARPARRGWPPRHLPRGAGPALGRLRPDPGDARLGLLGDTGPAGSRRPVLRALGR